jgi:diguanylate cyclase (GGDEF)-like protein
MDHIATRIVLIDPDGGPRALAALDPVSDGDVTIHRVPGLESAREAATVLRPDLIVLAAKAAEPDGADLCDSLRTDPQTARIPILALVLDAPSDCRSAAALAASWLQRGADDALTAPMPPDLLRARVGLLVEMRRLRQDSIKAVPDDSAGPLATHRVFEATLRRESERLRRSDGNLALMLVDIDHAAAWREAAGDMAFETIVHRVGETLARRLRRPPDLAARLGPERMVGLMPETDLRGARVVAESILGAVTDLRIPHPDPNHSAPLSVSIGLASHRCSGPEVETWLMTEAMDRLSLSRRAGGNRLSALSTRRAGTLGVMGLHEDDGAFMNAATTWGRRQGTAAGGPS